MPFEPMIDAKFGNNTGFFAPADFNPMRLCVSKFFGFPLCLSELCERNFFYLVVVSVVRG